MNNRSFEFRIWSNRTRKFIPLETIGCQNIEWLSKQTYFDGRETKPEYIIQQFTGFLDKKGVKVFEGDIIKFRAYSDPARIKWDNYAYFVTWDDGTRELLMDLKTISFKVIGNILENPELL